jgi:hypothetical protein
VLQRVPDLVGGDRRAGDAGDAEVGFREAHRARARVVVVAQLAGHGLDLDVVQAVGAQDGAGGVGAGQAGGVGDALPAAVGAAEPHLHAEGEHEGDDEEREHGEMVLLAGSRQR